MITAAALVPDLDLPYPVSPRPVTLHIQYCRSLFPSLSSITFPSLHPIPFHSFFPFLTFRRLPPPSPFPSNRRPPASDKFFSRRRLFLRFSRVRFSSRLLEPDGRDGLRQRPPKPHLRPTRKTSGGLAANASSMTSPSRTSRSLDVKRHFTIHILSVS